MPGTAAWHPGGVPPPLFVSVSAGQSIANDQVARRRSVMQCDRLWASAAAIRAANRHNYSPTRDPDRLNTAPPSIESDFARLHRQ